VASHVIHISCAKHILDDREVVQVLVGHIDCTKQALHRLSGGIRAVILPRYTVCAAPSLKLMKLCEEVD
jgi:hypothetical protein